MGHAGPSAVRGGPPPRLPSGPGGLQRGACFYSAWRTTRPRGSTSTAPAWWTAWAMSSTSGSSPSRLSEGQRARACASRPCWAISCPAEAAGDASCLPIVATLPEAVRLAARTRSAAVPRRGPQRTADRSGPHCRPHRAVADRVAPEGRRGDRQGRRRGGTRSAGGRRPAGPGRDAPCRAAGPARSPPAGTPAAAVADAPGRRANHHGPRLAAPRTRSRPKSAVCGRTRRPRPSPCGW